MVDGFDALMSGGSDYGAIKGADVMIVTAGFPRTPGMSRDDLIGKNAGVIAEVAAGIRANCPDALVICITNPLDAMVWVMKQKSGLPANRVSAWPVSSTARASGCSWPRSSACRWRTSPRSCWAGTATDGAADALLDGRRHPGAGPGEDGLEHAGEDRRHRGPHARDGGGEIVKLLERGSAFYAPAASAVAMAESYLKDKKRVLPCAALLNGEYGVKDLYVGVPVVIGAGGIEDRRDCNECRGEGRVRQVLRGGERAGRGGEEAHRLSSASADHEHPRIPGQGAAEAPRRAGA